MKHIYQIELYFERGESKVWSIWGFTTFKRAVEFGEYKYRTWEEVKYYRIRETEMNPEWFRLTNKYYSKI